MDTTRESTRPASTRRNAIGGLTAAGAAAALGAPAVAAPVEDPHPEWMADLSRLCAEHAQAGDDNWEARIDVIDALETRIGSTPAHTPAGALVLLDLVADGGGGDITDVMTGGQIPALDSLRAFLERLAGEGAQ